MIFKNISGFHTYNSEFLVNIWVIINAKTRILKVYLKKKKPYTYLSFLSSTSSSSEGIYLEKNLGVLR